MCGIMCGIMGLMLGHWDNEDTPCLAASDLHEALYYLQHRGQDACGIATCATGGRIYRCEGNGLATQVFEGNVPDSWVSDICVILGQAPAADNDSELMLNIIANELNETEKARVNTDDIFKALSLMCRQCDGAFACTGMVAGYLDRLFLQKWHEPEFSQVHQPKAQGVDIFEYIYFARLDSIIHGISVYKSRQNMGHKLANKILNTLGKEVIDEIDVVIPIPETATTAAAVVAERLGNPCFLRGPVANALITSTRKTSREIITMAREFKATKVLFASIAPRSLTHTSGIDLASPANLIAHNRDRHDVAKHIGADEFIYQDLQDLVDACTELAPKGPDVTKFEVGVFCSKYITEVPPGYCEHLDQVRGNKREMPVVEEIQSPSETANGGSLKRSSAEVTTQLSKPGHRPHMLLQTG
ncbi:hypothetical protein DL767_002386 [Monosporascus sp. MG133]|nr:hypothetical protein DL767_002386 [Monosporascus sp. MG133]